MSGTINYISCGVLWLGLTLKVPDLVRHRRDPFLLAVCAPLGLAGLSFLLGAAPTVGAINRISGIPNLAAPLTYASITAYSAASLVLIVYWRGGDHVQRTSRRWITGYGIVLLGIAAAFPFGDAPVERRTDLDTYYATTPYIREMIILYLIGHLVAAGATTALSLRWGREVHGWLHAGLLTLGAGSAFNACYSVSKLIAVVARWFGRDWSALSTTVSPAVAGLGALLSVAGILIPLAGPQLTTWERSRRAYKCLGPLERELDEILTREALRLPRPRRASPATRLMWRQTSIHNALSYLDVFFDRALFEQTHSASLRETGDWERAEAAAWAAVITAAVHRATDPGDTPAAPAETDRFFSPPPGSASLLLQIADELAASTRVAATPVRLNPTTKGTA
ncbi:MAB_1171c family putative transporter [Streptomyces sp. ADMS]|uniref:MAB_1171c family putative transporter n=1 Tax=Streptomyces sp. ADMS TaxID=3071415 RepID=UPI00296EBAE1|nr:MAB_1171c family putative transporter [Streptomyces sp. ADMS]MDW4910066.1 MAB_1171c family putative transporter [Streptomyces sp. ADMS]